MTSKEMAEKIAKLMEDRKAKNIQIINIENVTIVTDYFIICSGTSTTHNRGIADLIMEELNKLGKSCSHIEGYETARWILIDYFDVVVHIFHEEDRQFYNLERLWRDGIFEYTHPDENIKND
ncbi:MAG: ribosome silencing factor [Clostridiales bacterium]|jgi:ribosome-associated protein|nr:ribosome silencing factor [Clostridiales bacterium]